MTAGLVVAIFQYLANGGERLGVVSLGVFNSYLSGQRVGDVAAGGFDEGDVHANKTGSGILVGTGIIDVLVLVDERIEAAEGAIESFCFFSLGGLCTRTLSLFLALVAFALEP